MEMADLGRWSRDGSDWGCPGNPHLMDLGKEQETSSSDEVWYANLAQHRSGISVLGGRVPRVWMPGCWSGAWHVVSGTAVGCGVAGSWLLGERCSGVVHCEFVTVSLLGFDSNFSVNLCTQRAPNCTLPYVSYKPNPVAGMGTSA